jgi:hypothetical protein
MVRPAEPHRTPGEVREYESKVWDLTRHLVHPAFLYVVLQIALWCGLERHPSYQTQNLSFWEGSLIHLLQFLGAWGVFYGTLLRDMRMKTRVPTILLWIAAAGAAAAWLWPQDGTPRPIAGLHLVLAAQLVAAVAGWAVVMVTWRRAKARHEAAAGGPPRG